MTHSNNNIPDGYCQCGCGQRTTIATRTYGSRGIVRGQPFRYMRGHANRRQVRRITTVSLTCAECGIAFERPVNHIRPGTKNSFCSRDCKKAFQRHNQPMLNGYPIVRINGQKVFIHRIVAEEKIGRPLRPGEVVHHINGIKTDFRAENLQVMTRASHKALHHTLDRWAKNFDACVRCGTTLIPHMGYGHCQFCYNNHLRKVPTA